jgi:hypothetical protein
MSKSHSIFLAPTNWLLNAKYTPSQSLVNCLPCGISTVLFFHLACYICSSFDKSPFLLRLLPPSNNFRPSYSFPHNNAKATTPKTAYTMLVAAITLLLAAPVAETEKTLLKVISEVLTQFVSFKSSTLESPGSTSVTSTHCKDVSSHSTWQFSCRKLKEKRSRHRKGHSEKDILSIMLLHAQQFRLLEL